MGRKSKLKNDNVMYCRGRIRFNGTKPIAEYRTNNKIYTPDWKDNDVMWYSSRYEASGYTCGDECVFAVDKDKIPKFEKKWVLLRYECKVGKPTQLKATLFSEYSKVIEELDACEKPIGVVTKDFYELCVENPDYTEDDEEWVETDEDDSWY